MDAPIRTLKITDPDIDQIFFNLGIKTDYSVRGVAECFFTDDEIREAAIGKLFSELLAEGITTGLVAGKYRLINYKTLGYIPAAELQDDDIAAGLALDDSVRYPKYLQAMREITDHIFGNVVGRLANYSYRLGMNVGRGAVVKIIDQFIMFSARYDPVFYEHAKSALLTRTGSVWALADSICMTIDEMLAKRSTADYDIEDTTDWASNDEIFNTFIRNGYVDVYEFQNIREAISKGDKELIPVDVILGQIFNTVFTGVSIMQSMKGRKINRMKIERGLRKIIGRIIEIYGKDAVVTSLNAILSIPIGNLTELDKIIAKYAYAAFLYQEIKDKNEVTMLAEINNPLVLTLTKKVTGPLTLEPFHPETEEESAGVQTTMDMIYMALSKGTVKPLVNFLMEQHIMQSTSQPGKDLTKPLSERAHRAGITYTLWLERLIDHVFSTSMGIFLKFLMESGQMNNDDTIFWTGKSLNVNTELLRRFFSAMVDDLSARDSNIEELILEHLSQEHNGQMLSELNNMEILLELHASDNFAKCVRMVHFARADTKQTYEQ